MDLEERDMLVRYSYGRDCAVLEKKWNILYKDNPYLFPYSSFDYNKYIKKYKSFKPTTLFQKDIFLVYSCEGKDLLLMPLSIHHKELIIFGDNISGAGNLDFVYAQDITDQHFLQALEELRGIFPGYKLRLNKINERSRFYKFLHENKEILAEKFNMTEEMDRVCVKISFSDSYNEYFQGLSKKCRYYLRKAQSDIKKDDLGFDLKVFSGPMKNEKFLTDMMRIYTNRESLRKKRKIVFLAFLKNRYLSALVWAIKKLSTQYTFCYYINGEIAAYMTGFATNYKEIVFPVLAMNDNYAKYTPGKLMICKSIEYLQEHTSIRSIDLSRGDETYKIVLGGIKHYNYRFTLEL